MVKKLIARSPSGTKASRTPGRKKMTQTRLGAAAGSRKMVSGIATRAKQTLPTTQWHGKSDNGPKDAK